MKFCVECSTASTELLIKFCELLAVSSVALEAFTVLR